jgi:hypothetical protein
MSMAKRIGAANFNLLVIDTENKVRSHGLHGVPFCNLAPLASMSDRKVGCACNLETAALPACSLSAPALPRRLRRAQAAATTTSPTCARLAIHCYVARTYLSRCSWQWMHTLCWVASVLSLAHPGARAGQRPGHCDGRIISHGRGEGGMRAQLTNCDLLTAPA